MEWQPLITGLFVGIATLIVARRLLRILSSKPNKPCGSCGGCSGKATSLSATPLVQLGSVKTTTSESP